MKSKAIKFLEKHQSGTPSKFEEEARRRQENEIWLRMSRSMALTIVEPDTLRNGESVRKL